MFDFGDKKCSDCEKVLTSKEKKQQCIKCKKTWCNTCLPNHATGKGYCRECEKKITVEEVREDPDDEKENDKDMVTLCIMVTDSPFEFRMSRQAAEYKMREIKNHNDASNMSYIQIKNKWFSTKHMLSFWISEDD